MLVRNYKSYSNKLSYWELEESGGANSTWVDDCFPDGICHIFVDKSANIDMARRVVLDAKVDYPAACNAMVLYSGLIDGFFRFLSLWTDWKFLIILPAPAPYKFYLLTSFPQGNTSCSQGSHGGQWSEWACRGAPKCRYWLLPWIFWATQTAFHVFSKFFRNEKWVGKLLQLLLTKWNRTWILAFQWNIRLTCMIMCQICGQVWHCIVPRGWVRF